MLNYNNILKDELNHNGLSIREISPVMKLNLRGKRREFFTTVGKNLHLLPLNVSFSTREHFLIFTNISNNSSFFMLLIIFN